MRIVKTLFSLAVLGAVGFALVQVALRSGVSRPDEATPRQDESAAIAGSSSTQQPPKGTSSESFARETADEKSGPPPPRLEESLQAPLLDLPGTHRATLDRAAFERRLAETRAVANKGETVAALATLSKLYWEARLAPPERSQLIEQLDAWSQQLYFTKAHTLEPAYVIQPGDSLERIGKKYNLSWEFLARINAIQDPRRIRAGQRLKVLRGPFEAVIDLSDFELTVMLDGRFVRRYDVGIGKDGTTPLGTFTVREKQPNPKYWGDPVREADDPENPLGEHWIGIGNSYGIHGTIAPESIGKRESAGCIRMLPDDVAEVYDLLVVGARVRIQP